MNDSTNPIDSKKFLNSNASHLLFQRAFGRPGGLKPRAHDKGARFPLGTIYEYRKDIVRRNQRKRQREKKGENVGQGTVNSQSGQDRHSTSSRHPRSDDMPGRGARPSNFYCLAVEP